MIVACGAPPAATARHDLRSNQAFIVDQRTSQAREHRRPAISRKPSFATRLWAPCWPWCMDQGCGGASVAASTPVGTRTVMAGITISIMGAGTRGVGDGASEMIGPAGLP